MSNELRIKLQMLIATFVAQVSANETTKKIDKLRKQCRAGLRKVIKQLGPEEYTRISSEANEVWESAKSSLDRPEAFTVPLSTAMNIVYDLIDDKKHKAMWFTFRTFDDAVHSLAYGFNTTRNDEDNALWLVNKFREGLGIETRKEVLTYAEKVKQMQVLKALRDKDKLLEGD